MKKIILSITLGLAMVVTTASTYAATNENTKAVKHFTRQFKKASETSWNPSEEGFIVNFTDDGHRSTAAYDKNGKWIYTIRRYTADNLDRNIVDIVKDSYYYYYITGIERVEQRGSDAVYLVHLEDKNTLKTVRITNGDTELVQDFVKG